MCGSSLSLGSRDLVGMPAKTLATVQREDHDLSRFPGTRRVLLALEEGMDVRIVEPRRYHQEQWKDEESRWAPMTNPQPECDELGY